MNFILFNSFIMIINLFNKQYIEFYIPSLS